MKDRISLFTHNFTLLFSGFHSQIQTQATVCIRLGDNT